MTPLVAMTVVAFLSLGGTAFAAGALARNSVGSTQLKADAVSSGKVRNGTLTGNDVADSSLTGRDLANGSVTGTDLANGSIGGTKIAGNSVGLQAVERSTQDYFTNVPATRVLPGGTSDVSLNLSHQPVLTWTVPAKQEGLNLMQAQVTIRSSKSITASCEITVDGGVLTRVRQTIAKSTSVSDYASIPLTAMKRLAPSDVVTVRCDAGEANAAVAVVVDPVDDLGHKSTTVESTSMTVVRLAG